MGADVMKPNELPNMVFNAKRNLLTRRSALQLGAAAALSGSLAGSHLARAGQRIPYGVAVNMEPFRNDPEFKELLIRYVDVIVPMNALKWHDLRHTKGQFDFTRSDELISFAERHGKKVHGHALLWYHANPAWLEVLNSPRRLEALLIKHIETVVGRYAGRVQTWDVVNEVVAHDPLSEGKWRRGIWYDTLGFKHVDIAFSVAARTDPTAKLFINDYDLEDDSLRTKKRQDIILSIVRRLQDKNIPIHGVGLQAHLYAERAIGAKNLASFIRQLEILGLEVSITELDIIDWKLSADIEARDRAVANVAKEFLSAVTDVTKPRTITSWGMSDRYSWIDDTFPRNDSAKARPLPFDRNWKPKPMFDVIRSFTG